MVERLHPELAHLEVGDVLLDSADCDPDVGAWRVVDLRSERSLVLRSQRTLGKGSELRRAGRGPWIDSSWAFVLRPLGPSRTRLLSRTRVALSPAWAIGLLRPIFVPGDTVMQRTMLQGIKVGAEGATPHDNESSTFRAIGSGDSCADRIPSPDSADHAVRLTGASERAGGRSRLDDGDRDWVGPQGAGGSRDGGEPRDKPGRC